MLKNILKSNNRKLILTIIFVVIAIISMIGKNYFNNKDNSSELKPKDYNNLITKGKDTENTYVSIKLADIPHQIAEEKVNYSIIKYYILYDKNNYMYVAKLTDENYKKIEEQYNKQGDEFSYNLTGYIYKTPDDLRDIIIDAYNESNSSHKITKDNYSKYFGSTYLDDTYTKYTASIAIFYMISITSTVVAIIFGVQWIICLINTRKTLSKYDKQDLDEELQNAQEYEKAKIYLTNNYFISTYKGLHVYTYSDISWVYSGSVNGKFYSINKFCIRMFLVDKTKYDTKSLDYTKKEIFNEIFEELQKRNSNIMFGYNFENLNAYNKIQKS